LVSLTTGKFVGQLSGYELLKKVSSPRRYLSGIQNPRQPKGNYRYNSLPWELSYKHSNSYRNWL